MQEAAGSTPRVEVQAFIENLQRQARSTGLLPETRQQLQEAFEARDLAARQTQELQELGCLMDQAHVVVRDLDDRIIRWTSGAQHLYGFTAEPAVGRNSHDLLQTQFPEPLERIRHEFFASGRWQGEVIHRGVIHRETHGHQIVVASQWALRRDADGKPVAIVEVNNPITERKRVEETLRKSEAFIRQIMDASPNLVFVKDEVGRFFAVNQAMAELFATSAEALV